MKAVIVMVCVLALVSGCEQGDRSPGRQAEIIDRMEQEQLVEAAPDERPEIRQSFDDVRDSIRKHESDKAATKAAKDPKKNAAERALERILGPKPPAWRILARRAWIRRLRELLSTKNGLRDAIIDEMEKQDR